MHSLIILGVYLCMLFAPCAVAQWGDVLTLPQWSFLSRRRRRRQMDPVFAEMEEAFAAAELRRVMREAFIAPAALPGFGTAPATFAAALEAVAQKESFAAASARIAARLAQLSAARKQALAPAPAVNFEAIPADVVAAEKRAIAKAVAEVRDVAIAAVAPVAVPDIVVPAFAVPGISLVAPPLPADTWLVAASTDAAPTDAAPMFEASFPFANAPMPAHEHEAVAETAKPANEIFFQEFQEEDERIAA